MVRVLLNTDDHHAHGSSAGGKAGSVVFSATGEQYSLSTAASIDDSSVLGSHHCKVFEMASLLTDARWIGASVLHIELLTSDRPHAYLFCHRLRKALAGLVDLKLTLVNNHTVKLSQIDIKSVAVDAARLLPLAEFILMVEVEKDRNWRAKPSGAAGSSSNAATAPAAPSPFQPSSLTGPSHPAGASNCCTLLHGRGDFLAAITAEVASSVRCAAHLKRALKAHAASSEALYEDPAEKQAAERELAEAEASELAIAAQEAAAAAATAAASSSPAATAVPAASASSKSSPPLATRVRTHLQRTEAHHQRLVQILQSELPAISLMHTCNICTRVLRIEGDKHAPTAAQAALSSALPIPPRGTVSEQELQMLRELSLHARDSDAAAAALSSSSASSAFAGIAAASASAAHSAVPSTDAPLLTAAQVHARLLELQAKLRAASGADAKSRRKKISKKIQELRARYAPVIMEHHLGGPDAELE